MSKSQKHIPEQLRKHIRKVRVSRSGMTRWYALSPEAWNIIDKRQFSGRTVYRETRDGLLMTKDGIAGLGEIIKCLSPLRKATLRIVKK